jgi:starch synthase
MAKKRPTTPKTPNAPPVPTPPQPEAPAAPAAPAKPPAPAPASRAKPAPAAKPVPAKRTPPVPPPAVKPVAPPKPRAPRRKPDTARTAADGAATTPGTVVKPVAAGDSASASLDILMITPEARPFATTGGLADVCGALPPALARLGHRVTIVLPKYRDTVTDGAAGEAMQVPFGIHSYPVRFIEQRLGEGVTAVLIDAPDLFDRDGLYGDRHGEYGDNAFRFAVLCRGALEYARLRGRRPSVIHAHDWQAGLAALYARTALRDDAVIGGVRTVLTVHNLAFQGMFEAKELNWIGIGPDLYTPELLEFYGRASALKAGIVFSDVITTVSPTYAREIVTPEYGFGFDGILRARQADLVGILNGIDTATWDPRKDPHLPAHFDAGTLARKAEVKRALLEYIGMASSEAAMARPLVGIVTRLTHQKGCDLFASAADRLMAFDASWVMLGSGDAWCEDLWRDLARRFPERVAARIAFDDRLAHLIEGGADLFLMPSWYEPCGLNQMYSLRYGTLPVVRATGGLQDTVVDREESADGATGFKFRHYTAEALVGAVERALMLYRDNPRAWRQMQRAGMARDFSWDVSAREYVKVYRGH